MTNKDEALKMAIKALLTGHHHIDLCNEAINACKEALERQSNMVAVPLDKLQDMQRRLSDCEEYLKEDETPAECIARNRKDANTTLKLLAKCMGEKKALEQPTWQGLTDDEINEIVRNVSDDMYPWKGNMLIGKIIRAIEQALKDKNHA